MPDPRLEDQLSREILLGQRLRATILAGVFGVITLLLVAMVMLDERLGGASLVPGGIPAVPAVLAAHQAALRWYIGGRLRAGGRIPEWFWYANGLIEITSVTFAVVVVSRVLRTPVHALTMPPVYVYFAFIILSTLRLDFRSSVFTGAVAGAQLLATYFWLRGPDWNAGSFEPLVDSPYPFVVKGFLLAGSGLAAGFVARELRQRIFGAVAAAAERERAEEAGRAKTAFLANMSHEIRTPLNAIVGYAELLEKDGSLDGDHRHAVRTMRASGDHLLGVINQVLDLSRIEAGREELRAAHFDLADLVAELTAMFELRCREKGLTWRAQVDAGADGSSVRGDAVRLRQVLINLAGNAVRLTDSGEVCVGVRGSLAAGGDFTFEVRDTGPGIASSEQARIFEPFRTDGRERPERGSGLGLAIAHAQVRLMGGRLAVESHPGAGARFWFTIPLEVPAAEPRGDRATAGPGAPTPSFGGAIGNVVGIRGRRVVAVVADPSPVSRELLARMLRRIGVETREAGTGAAALEAAGASGAGAAESARGSDGADVVFLDPGLPDLPTGEARARLRALADGSEPGDGGGKRPAIVVVTASALDHERRAFLDAGADAVVIRPVETARLYDSLAAVLGVELDRRPAPDDGDDDPAAARPLAGDPPSLPDSIWRSLRGAAAEYNITDLRKHLDRLDELGEDTRPLAEYLRRLTRTYDLEAIRAALDRVPHG